MEKQQYIERAIGWVKKRGFRDLKANHDDYDDPTQFTRPDEDQPYVPDITAKKVGNKSYFEVAIKSDDVHRKVSKWKLLSTLASMKGGKLFLLAPRGHKAFVQRVLDKYSVNAKLVYMPNI
jgi:hypothetical protein